jgi:tRNA dimethylallyltransferase
MMYIDAVCDGIDDIPTVDDDTRTLMMERYHREGLEALAEELRLLDPEYYAQCDIRNPKRVIHALEICHMTGKTYTSFRVRRKKQRPFRILKIGLQREREDLFDRINRRVTQMVEQGALEEVRRVMPFRAENSLNTVGVKELLKVLDGEWELNFALDRLRKNTRVYAKKQMTWFKKDDTIHWFHPEQEAEILAFVAREVGEG